MIGDNAIVVTGITSSDKPIDAATMLAAFGNLDGLGIATVQVPPYEPGVEATSTEGDVYFVALGDSLAAAVGVASHADGYVAQVHRQLSLQDGTVYGLRNFGKTGETSGTMLLGNQLEQAVQFGEENEVAYVSIDIGANDLLGHLASADCGEDVEAAPCASRIEASLGAYRQNIRAIFDELEDAFPDATIVFLLAYNPFSLGFEDEVTFEAQSNEVLAELNNIATAAATEFGFLVADGFTPMRGTTTATTHMTNSPPDIHPNEIGYDVLTAAVLEALG